MEKIRRDFDFYSEEQDFVDDCHQKLSEYVIVTSDSVWVFGL